MVHPRRAVYRNALIYTLYALYGKTQTEIARRFNISVARCQQICRNEACGYTNYKK